MKTLSLAMLSLAMLLAAGCGSADPHAGHAAAVTPEAAPPDPHAGHNMPTAPAAVAADPHAGHSEAGADKGTPSVGSEQPMVMPVMVAPGIAAALGLRTVPARSGSAAQERRAPAVATFDPARTRRVTLIAGGQIREERVPRVGETVRAGQVLARIWLPEIQAAFAELGLARPLGEPWASGARSRLLSLGVPVADIDAAGDRIPETWTLRAPISGLILSRPVREGSSLGPGGLVAEIASTDARVVEMVADDPPPIGTPVILSDGTTSWAATVTELLPTAGTAGRSLRLLPKGDIAVGRPLTATWLGLETEGVWVPRGAVVDTGTRRLVFVAGPEGYSPRPVTLGLRTALEVQVTAGLAPGEAVVAAGTFLFDSETQMTTGGSGHAGHGG